MLKRKYLPWVMWSLPLSFFAFQFVLRLIPGLLMPEFMNKYQVSATEYGLFASVYYLGYALMQIPIALMLERWGPRLVMGTSVIVCGFAVWMLVFFSTWETALLSRFLYGACSVVGFLGTSMILTQWFPKKSYTTLVGLTFSIGLLGALYGGKPFGMLLSQMGWENVLTLLGLIAILLGIFMYITIRRPSHYVVNTQTHDFAVMKKLLANKSLWLLAFGNFLMVGALEGFADVWGVPYLMASRGMAKSDAAGLTAMIFAGMLVGGPILGYFSEKYNAHFKVVSLCGIGMALLMCSLFAFNDGFSDQMLGCLLFLVGILCCYQVIVFSIGHLIVPLPLFSVTIALLNCINMLGGSFYHSALGLLMDFIEIPMITDGVRCYAAHTYTMSLLLIPAGAVLGACLVMLSKMLSENRTIQESCMRNPGLETA